MNELILNPALGGCLESQTQADIQGLRHKTGQKKSNETGRSRTSTTSKKIPCLNHRGKAAINKFYITELLKHL